MNNILTQILNDKVLEVKNSKELIPQKKLERSPYFESPTISLTKYITRKDKSGIIAEIKRKSPSKGEINPYINVEALSIGYMQAGASALSILTDQKYFGGSLLDLEIARKFNLCPILRKDFFIDEYQIYEARSHGADAILLIAAALNKTRLQELYDKARELSLEVLFEIHSEDEIEKLPKYKEDGLIIGVNNRNLANFNERLEVSKFIINKLPKDLIKVSESGINLPEEVLELKRLGYEGFLIGERFMRGSDPAYECLDFINHLSF